jgi:urease accessory protein
VYDAAIASRDGALARARGAARIELAPDETGATRLVRLGQRSPVRVILPRAEGADAVAILLNTAGGVCGGDRLELAANLAPGARATLVGQAAEKIYRAIDRPAEIRTHLEVSEGAALHWAPQETLLFDGAMLERRTELRTEPHARLLAAETLVFGRRAMGEIVRDLHLRDDWRLFRSGRLVWADSLRLVAPAAGALAAPSGFAGCEALCTLVLVGDALEAARDAARAVLDLAPVTGGATVLNGVLVARALGASAEIRRALTELLCRLRGDALGFAPALPRVWSC